ncbi:MAG TPA: metalloregulator ArsR/SmtB family transcription factor [Candidatus Dormibacteraeota bacterium]|nr:metalloregulator ArsR/SmtB family transcription factor [Candidatus Dormibacteraeota bacterium]
MAHPGTHRPFKDELYREFARVGGALASPKRLEMLDLLAQRERTVEDLAGELHLSVANASQHLRVLLSARLVEVRRDGHFAFYGVAGLDVIRLCHALRDAAEERLADVHAIALRHLGAREGAVDPVEAGELLDLVASGRIVLLDVRPVEEYRAGHLPGARALPIEQLRQGTDGLRLSRRREIVAYCRGPYCVFADEAVALLREHGFRARRLRSGPPDWRARGWPVVGDASA